MKEGYIYKSNGNYLAFIKNDFLYSRDGVYMGWLDGNFAWDVSGRFRGQFYVVNGHNYIFINKFAISPLPKIPRQAPGTSITPTPPPNIIPISLPLGYEDGF